jgi:large subunit ribosomal protein L22
MEAIAKYNGAAMSPRKMRFWAETINGLNTERALAVLKHSPKKGCVYLQKLLLSAISNWQIKYGSNENVSLDSDSLFVKSIVVNAGNVLKRIKPAPQGRAHRIRKRYSNIILVLSLRQKTQDNGS